MVRAGVELNFPSTTTARATLREATVKAREGKARVGESKLTAYQWSIIISNVGMELNSPRLCNALLPGKYGI